MASEEIPEDGNRRQVSGERSPLNGGKLPMPGE